MNTKIVLFAAGIVVIGGVVFWTSSQRTPPASPLSESSSDQSATAAAAPVPSSQEHAPALTVIFADSGYSPSVLTVHKGDAVTFVNQSSENMWTASGIHPTHTLYSGTPLSAHCPDAANTSFDECGGIEPGGSWSFTFEKAGTWKYHNHLDAGKTGTIIVQ